jgi:hypothetical protein
MSQESTDRIDSEELLAEVTEIFERKIRPLVHDEDPYAFVVIDLDSEEFLVGTDPRAMTEELRAGNSKARLTMRRVGFPVAHWFGGGMPRPGHHGLRKKS